MVQTRRDNQAAVAQSRPSAAHSGGFAPLPESPAAEAAVLGAMIIDPSCIPDVMSTIDGSDFLREEHRIIFEAIRDLYSTRNIESLDGLLVRDWLDKKRQLETIGGAQYLQQVIETVPSSANVLYYAEIVKTASIRRQVIVLGHTASTQAYDEAQDILEVVSQIQAKAEELSLTGQKDEEVVAIPNLLMDLYSAVSSRETRLAAAKTDEEKAIARGYVPTGYLELDKLLVGLWPGELTLIAARPSIGKSALMMNIAEYLAGIEKVPVAVYSMEMPKMQLAIRAVCCEAGLDAQSLRQGNLNTEQFEKLLKAAQKYADMPLYVIDRPALSPMELRARTRKLKKDHGVRCIFIDYLQLMSSGTRAENRQQEVSTISRQLKLLARELEIPVVALSQLNRALEGREGHKPRMSDLRESGSLEQESDTILLLHREDYFHKDDPSYTPTNIAAKQRNGPTGTVRLIFRGEKVRFENMSHMTGPEPPLAWETSPVPESVQDWAEELFPRR